MTVVCKSARARLMTSVGLVLAAYSICMPNVAFAQSDDSIETVTVTGSRLGGGFDAPTPVTVINSEQLKLSGVVNVEDILNQTPQFREDTGSGKFANGGGIATLDLRGLGAQRNLVLVNGRRYTISGPDQTTDVNTIPTALIDRTEVVTGGSSAVYGSDAIAGVVNFVMKQNFTGLQADAHTDFDSITTTPTYSIDLTAGSNFDHDRGNIAVSIGYLNRGAITRQDHGGVTYYPTGDGCVTPSTFSKRYIGTQITGVSGQACLNAGGVMGLVYAGSGDIPNGRYTPQILPNTAASNPTLNAAYAAAGLGNIGTFGYTYNDAGTTSRAAIDPTDRYNLTLVNYMQQPQERWMINSFLHYDLLPGVQFYSELHFSDNNVIARLSPSNFNATYLFNDNNPYLSPAMQGLLTQLDKAEPAGGITTTEGSGTFKTTPNDGIAAMNVGRRFTDVGYRISNNQRYALRYAGGLRGDLGSVSDDFFKDLSYDAYYDYARTTNTEHQSGSISPSRLQANLLEVNGAAPVCNIFGQNISQACINAIAISSTNVTYAESQGANASVKGTVADLPAGPLGFALGGEWRLTSAQFVPDQFLAYGDVAGFNAAKPTQGHESVREIYGEIRVPLLKDLPFIKSLTANSAFRNSDYDLTGVGDVWTYSAGGDWRVDDNVAFRGQYQHAIRAPNVGELFGGQALNFTTLADPCSNQAPAAKQTATVRALCVATGVPAANVFGGQVQSNTLIGNVGGGNPNLSAEQSETLTLGTVLTPQFIPNLTLSVDWYSVNVNGAIAQLGGGLSNTLNLCYYTLQSATSIYCGAVNREPNTGQINAPGYVQVTNANTGALKTEGVDFEGNYNMDLGFGVFENESNLNINTDWTWTNEYTITPVKELPNNKNECVGSFGVTCGSPIPALRGNVRLTWNEGPLSVSVRNRFVGSVTVDTYILPFRSTYSNPALNTFTNPVIPDMDYIDLSASYDVNDNLRVMGGVNNLFNIAPPVLGASQSASNGYPATYDSLGQEFFINVTARTN